MMRVKNFLVGLCALLAMVPALAQQDPQRVVINTAETVLAEVSARKAELEADSSLIYPLVERTVVPHFDFESMARSAMGRFWRLASPQQQRRVVAEFQELLVRTYATALLGYSGQQIEYPPMHVADGAQSVMVPTKITAEGGPPVPVNYRLKTIDGEWMVYDVVIDGISLVTNYRSTFARQIQLGAAKEKDGAKRMSAGIDSLIDALSAKNDKSA
jgi:phospholipid transport system substrate-binding protein